MAFIVPMVVEAAASIGEAAATVGSTATAAASSIGSFASAAGTIGSSAVSAGGGISWLGTLGSVASGVGGVLGALGQYQQGQAAANAARYNAQIAAGNARVAKENAAIAGQAGEQQAFMTGEKARALVGSLKANQAASGIDVNSGSAVDVRSSAAELGELDALTVRSNATREAYGYSQQAQSFTNESALDLYEAKADSTAGTIGAASTFLGGLGDAASNYYKFQLAGGFTG